MTYSIEAIEEAISGVAQAHITPLGADVTTTMTDSGVLISASHKKWVGSQFVRLRGLSADRQLEMVHCATHAVALHLLVHLSGA